jgi:protoporphyrinogen oxidase
VASSKVTSPREGTSEQQGLFEANRSDEKRCVIIGGGPAGLTAAYELSQTGIAPLVLEQDDIVGGIARTVEHAGYRFDIGGHRFFTKVRSIDDWWKKILGNDMLVRSRLSRIHYKQTFFDYPLKPLNAMIGLGPLESLRIAASYAKAQVFPYPSELTFEHWICNRFGRRLYEIFFKNYTEKVWGMKCTEIGSDWAAQRIKNLNFYKLVRDMFLQNNKNEITTLIRQFSYPRLGPGMMWERVAQLLAERGFPVRFGHKVTRLHLKEGVVEAVTAVDKENNEVRFDGNHFISSMAIKDLIASFDKEAPDQVVTAARNLRYRDFITVGLIIDKMDIFKDNWIYVHSPNVKVGRIQNFKNWSPDMVANPSQSSLGLEYFVQKGDEIWNADDQDLITIAKKECAELGLIDEVDVIDGVVIRMEKAYPVYDKSYKENLAVIRSFLDTIPNLQLIGRNGQHRYNNQDHSMLTGIYAARNLCGAEYDLWEVNTESSYHEEGRQESIGDRLVPQRAQLDARAILQSAFARYDPYALGCALAVVLGLGLVLLMAPLLVDEMRGQLSLLRNYLIGFDTTWGGVAIGLLQICAGGFAFGFAMAHVINWVVAWHERRLLRKLDVRRLLFREPSEPSS